MERNVVVKEFNKLEVRCINIDNDILVFGRDACDTLGLSHYHMSKMPKEFIRLESVKSKSGAMQKTNLINKNGVNFLCSLVKNSDDFLQWVNTEIFNSESIEEHEQIIITDLNISTKTETNKLTDEKIKLLNNVTDILNEGGISTNAKLSILLTLLSDFGLDINKNRTI